MNDAQIQGNLYALNYSPGPLDGQIGTLGTGAVRTAQSGYGIEVDGVPGPVTQGKLMGQLAVVQQRLKDLGYYNGDIDGIWGPMTHAAIIAFQIDNGLSDDGIVGDYTSEKLFGTAAPSQPAAPPASNPIDGDMYTEHFSKFEMSCECIWQGGPGYCSGHLGEMHPELMRRLELVRQELNIPMSISSGFRCDQLNADVGGVWDSYHKLGRACDVPCISANGYSVDEMANCGERHGLKTIRYYNDRFVHYQWND